MTMTKQIPDGNKITFEALLEQMLLGEATQEEEQTSDEESFECCSESQTQQDT